MIDCLTSSSDNFPALATTENANNDRKQMSNLDLNIITITSAVYNSVLILCLFELIGQFLIQKDHLVNIKN